MRRYLQALAHEPLDRGLTPLACYTNRMALVNNGIYRCFRGFGIFLPSSCYGTNISDQYLSKIHRALRSAGFTSTRWQFVFDRQLAGLILPDRRGDRELHVRLYPDRIFAELEIGRTSPLHFVQPILNGNDILVDLLEPLLSEDELGELHRLTSRDRLAIQERTYPRCSKSALVNFIDVPPTANRLRYCSSLITYNILSWRVIAAAAAAAVSVAALASGSLLFFLLVGPLLGSIPILPRLSW